MSTTKFNDILACLISIKIGKNDTFMLKWIRGLGLSFWSHETIKVLVLKHSDLRTKKLWFFKIPNTTWRFIALDHLESLTMRYYCSGCLSKETAVVSNVLPFVYCGLAHFAVHLKNSSKKGRNS